MSDKQLFLNTVQSVIANHPDWFAETILSMQDGLVTRLDTEQKEKANLAYALAFFIQHAPNVAKKGGPLPSAYETLAKFFNGAPIEHEIRSLLSLESVCPSG